MLAQHKAFYGYPGGGIYYTYLGEPYLEYLRDPFRVYGSILNRTGFFAEDVARFGDRATVMIGGRFDHNPASLPDLERVNFTGEGTGEIVDGGDETYSAGTTSRRDWVSTTN